MFILFWLISKSILKTVYSENGQKNTYYLGYFVYLCYYEFVYLIIEYSNHVIMKLFKYKS